MTPPPAIPGGGGEGTPVDIAALTLHDVPEANRFEFPFDGGPAEMQYLRIGNLLILTHTEVPLGFEGQGLGGAMVRLVFDHARRNGLRVRSICPFVSAYLARHEGEFDDVLIRVGGS